MVTLFRTDENPFNKSTKVELLQKISEYFVPEECNLLEIGCANGRFGMLLGPSLKEYVGIDKFPKYIDIASKESVPSESVSYLVGDAEDIPLDREFDVVFYGLSFHMINNLDKSLEETRRVLKDDGKVIILEPSPRIKAWASPKLNKDSPEFDPKALEGKIAQLESAVEFLQLQTQFRVVYANVAENRSLYVLD